MGNTINSLQGLLELASNKYFTAARGQWIFRGHANREYQLTPSIGRAAHTSRSREKFEESIFSIFRREAQGYLESLPDNDWEWLALAQHHGLPTRLLDWTYNPLVAMYFVVQSAAKLDGEFFALCVPRQAPKEVREGSPFALSSPVKYFPTIVSPRIRAQEGLFIACSDLAKPLDADIRHDWELERHIVPAADKDSIRYALFRVGVHASSLFPDIDGLAARLKWQHSVKSPFGAL